MILLIDNYDSFSYNLYQLAASAAEDIQVIRNDECTVDEIEGMGPEALILSPGPGRPSEAGICEDAIRRFAGENPHPWSVSGTPGHMRSFRRYGDVCRETDARQTEQGVSGRQRQAFQGTGTSIHGCQISFSCGRGRISAGRTYCDGGG